jgi:hypothetical protein
MEIPKEEILTGRIIELEQMAKAQAEHLSDLIEYLERTDPKFERNPSTFDNWAFRLEEMRRDDQKKTELIKAKQLLRNDGYIVVRNENEIDAARVKQWIESDTSTDKTDDDIPF